MNDPSGLSQAAGTPAEGYVYGMPAHADRRAAVEEVHARPHLLTQSPRSLLQLSFMTEGDMSRDRAAIDDLSGRMGAAVEDHTTPHHALTWNEGDLHCEKHTEFSSYLWSAPLSSETGEPCGDNPFRQGFKPPGPVISAVSVRLLPWTAEAEKEIDCFDPVSRCYSLVENGAAAIVTDFRQDEEGLTHMLILDRDLTPARAGALAQRLLEVETYRTLALLALPLTRSMTSNLRRMEARLAAITEEMRRASGGRRDSDVLLSDLTSLAAELEADAAANLYRFGASRAYYEIVEERLDALAEDQVAGYSTWADFLYRRIAPAMRTCQSVKERQGKLSDKLTRSISLLRSWIDVELERQNRDLLASMNERAKVQLRLQQTVEGLSVAAISYYVVSLLAYLLKGLPGTHDIAATVTAILVPAVLLLIWWIVRRIRHAHGDSAIEDKA